MIVASCWRLKEHINVSFRFNIKFIGFFFSFVLLQIINLPLQIEILSSLILQCVYLRCSVFLPYVLRFHCFHLWWGFQSAFIVWLLFGVWITSYWHKTSAVTKHFYTSRRFIFWLTFNPRSPYITGSQTIWPWLQQVSLTWACDPNETQYMVNSKL